MVNRTTPSPSQSSLPFVWRALLLSRSLGWLGSLALLSSGAAWAQTDAFVDNLGGPPPAVPTASLPSPATVASPAPASAIAKPEKAPVAQPQPAPRPQPVAQPQPAPRPQPVAQPQPAPRPQPVAQPQPAPRLSEPTVSVPEPEHRAAPERLIDPPPAAQLPRTSSTNSFVDPTAYGTPTRAQQRFDAPRVVVSDRASGCETVGRSGRLAQNCYRSAPNPRELAAPSHGMTARRLSAPNPRNGATRSNLVATPVPMPQVWAQAAAEASARRGRRRGSVPVGGPIQVVPTEAGVPLPQGFTNPYTATASGRPIYPNNGNRGLLFPLSVPARLTSAFGWRQHPIFGSWRMHSGTDLGAPQGTPVVAAYRGQVALADYAGGYGLMVVLRHLDGTQESRYAHLAQIFVQPGDWVEQGELIGLVGSTGNSTGPHLHFEWRHHLTSGWVPVDAGPYLESALANLVHSIELAEAGFDPQDFYALDEDATEDGATEPLEELALGHAMLGIGTFFLTERDLGLAQGATPVGAAAARRPGQPQEVIPDPVFRLPALERRQVGSAAEAPTGNRVRPGTAG